MSFFSSFIRAAIGMAGAIEDHANRRYLYDQNEHAALNDDAKHLARRGWIDQNDDGTFTAFGTADDAWGNPQRWALSAASYDEAAALWQQAYGSINDPLYYDQPAGVDFRTGSRWWDADGAHHGLWDDHEPDRWAL